MTTITIPRALLEQALDALDVSRRFVYQDSRPQVDTAFDALNNELAKPVEPVEPVAWMWQHKETGRTGFIEANLAKDWTKLNPRQPLVMPVYSHTPTPAWHDAPETIALKLELESAKDAYLNACKLVADMHAAAVGAMTGPRLGVVEDVAALKAELATAMKNAEKYRWLAEYLVSDDESYDDQIVAARTVKEIDRVVSAAIAKAEGGAA